MHTSDSYDLVIVGAGPAGLGAAAHAGECGLRAVVLERAAHIADTIASYQAGKHVMAEPALVPKRCELPFEAGTREQILARWQRHVESKKLEILYGEEASNIEREGDGFVVTTRCGRQLGAKKVAVAVGTQGNPNRLMVDGEDLPHVKNRLVDPRDHDDEDIVVIGAGDSAIEIANSLAENNRVCLVVRKPEIVRAKEANERELLAKQELGELKIFFSTTAERIEPGVIHLKGATEDLSVKADWIYVKIGAQPPRRWLSSIGVQFSSEERDAKPLLSPFHECRSVPGLYLMGAITGRDLIKQGINQGYEVVEHIQGREVLPADEELLLPKLPFAVGTVSERLGFLKRIVPLFAETEAQEMADILLTVSFRPSMMLKAPDIGDLREAMLSARSQRYRKKQPIVRQNDYADSLMLIIEGSVEVRRRTEDGREHEVAQLAPGDFFGEMALISGRRSNATVVAREPSVVLELPRKTILQLMYRSLRVARLVDEAFLVRAFQGYLFPRVPTPVLRALAKTAQLLAVDRGGVVFEEGDSSDSFYFIRSGQVQLSKQSGGNEIVLTYLVSGNFFGEDALFADAARSATVRAIFPTELIVVARDDLERFIEQFPELAPKFRETFERRRLDSLAAEATPGRHEILEELIRGEVVIGTDALIIDDYKCVRCNNCVEACESVHSDGQARLSLTGIHFANILAPNSCWQCENPLCMLDCPPDALVRDSRGEIYIRENCIGCGNCESNCPYGNIFMVHPKPRGGPLGWLQRLVQGNEDDGRTVAVKCDLCRDIGGGPACVRSCPTGAAIRLNPEQYEETIAGLVEEGRWAL